MPLMSKLLWRKGYLRMPTTCSVEEHGTGDDSTCRASCPSEVILFLSFFYFVHPIYAAFASTSLVYACISRSATLMTVCIYPGSHHRSKDPLSLCAPRACLSTAVRIPRSIKVVFRYRMICGKHDPIHTTILLYYASCNRLGMWLLPR